MLGRARNISKEEMLQALTVMENLGGGLDLGSINLPFIKPTPDNRISLKELYRGCQKLSELLDQPPEKGLTKLRMLDKTWKKEPGGPGIDASPGKILGYYVRMLEVADFMYRYGSAIASVDGDDLISQNDIEKLWE